jgi:hypothetical protein
VTRLLPQPGGFEGPTQIVRRLRKAAREPDTEFSGSCGDAAAMMGIVEHNARRMAIPLLWGLVIWLALFDLTLLLVMH